MGYKLKTHSGASKRFKRTASSVKSRSANRNHILTKQSTKLSPSPEELADYILLLTKILI